MVKLITNVSYNLRSRSSLRSSFTTWLVMIPIYSSRISIIFKEITSSLDKLVNNLSHDKLRHTRKVLKAFGQALKANFSYALSVYGASESDLTVVQKFLDRCHKRGFISFPVFIKNLLNKQDRNILKKLKSTDCHPLKDIIPVQKTYLHNLRKKGCARPKINTQRFMNTFVNRLIFKLHLL